MSYIRYDYSSCSSSSINHQFISSTHRPRKHGVRGSIDPPHFFECGVNQCCLTPHLFMHKSMVGSRFMETLSVTVVVLSKIIKIVATRCQILRLKCTKFDFGWGSDPDPAGGAHSAPPDPLAGFKGAYF